MLLGINGIISIMVYEKNASCASNGTMGSAVVIWLRVQLPVTQCRWYIVSLEHFVQLQQTCEL